MESYLAKTVPPRLVETLPRERLFNLIDHLKTYPIILISSPAGSGKTTLVADYLKVTSSPAVWYRADETDGDPASFFYGMREAARNFRSRKIPLPLFTSDYQSGLIAFTKRYFEALFGRIGPKGVIVFDNYQDIPESSLLHEVVPRGLRLIHEGIKVFLISRKELPAQFVPLRAERILTSITWDHIRFTEKEMKKMIVRKQKLPASRTLVRRIYEQTQGWIAAIVLMLENDAVSPPTALIDKDSIFQYFSIEVFNRFEEGVRRFLLLTSILPTVSPQIAKRLTGVKESPEILAHLSKNNYFTHLYADSYQYHPLFKEFLLTQARIRYSPEEFTAYTRRAGQLLSGYGDIENAVRLFLAVGAFSDAVPLILKNAQMLISHGRVSTLENWMSKLPESIKENTPWLLYWLGMGYVLTRPTEARLLMERAFEVFEKEGNTEGGLLSAAAIIKSVILEWNDYAEIDRWTQWISRHVDIDKALPVPEIEIQIASAMVAGLTRRSFCDPALKIWVERTLDACKEVEDATIRLMAKSTILSYYGLLGHWAEMRIVAEDFRRTTVDPQVSPLLHLAQVLVIIETHDWVRGSWNDTYNRLIKGFQIAQELRAATHLGMILIYGVWIACEMEDVKMAEEFMQQLEQSPIIEKGMGRAFFHGIASLYHLQKGDAVTAYHYAELAVKASIEAGVPVMEAWNRIALAYALRQQGKSERADEQLKLSEGIVLPAGTTHMLYLIRLTQAGLFFDQGKPAEGAHALEKAFRIGREKGYGMTLFWHWQPREMARLCAEALSRGIETTYARELISKCRLAPPGNVAKLQSWPWPCQIRTFGDFEILVNGIPLVFTGKVQKKPLTLLKILISLGGRNVHEYTIEDLLWPDSEGDAAHIAFNTNLSRLRRLLGKEQIIEMKGGMLGLNEHLVYLDTWILEDLISNLMKEKRANRRAFNAELVEEYARLIIDTYRADFLPGDNDEWVSTCRERCRKKFAVVMEDLVSTFSEMGQLKKAEVYQGYRQNLNFSGVPLPPHR